jgi:hypothetical protein
MVDTKHGNSLQNPNMVFNVLCFSFIRINDTHIHTDTACN